MYTNYRGDPSVDVDPSVVYFNTYDPNDVNSKYLYSLVLCASPELSLRQETTSQCLCRHNKSPLPAPLRESLTLALDVTMPSYSLVLTYLHRRQSKATYISTSVIIDSLSNRP